MKKNVLISLILLLSSLARLNSQNGAKSPVNTAVTTAKGSTAITPTAIVAVPMESGSCDPEPNPCQGKTFTQGGWGAGNSNPASQYLNTHFNSYFPNGLTVGCGTKQLRLTSAAAVFAFLPSGSTPNILPTGTLTNPGSSYSNVLAGQLVALTLNMVFDANNPSFSPSASSLANYTISSGTFAGMTVGNFLALANAKIGGCSSSAYSYSQFNNTATAINENYDNGSNDDGLLECPPPCNITVNAVKGLINCFGGSTNVTITATGGTAPYTGTGIFSKTVGVHVFTVTDVYGCQAVKSVTITQPSQLIASASNGSIQCYGGTATICVNASGGTSPYSGTGTFVRPAGVHSFTVTDHKGCTAIITKTLTQPSQLILSATNGSINCYGGTATICVNATGGTAPYSGTGTFVRPAGVHSFTVTDHKGCTAVITKTLTQPNQLILSATNGSINCYGGTATICINATGGTSPYSGTGTFVRPAGVHSFTVTDYKGCTAVITKTLTQPSQLILSATNGSINCYGGTATICVNATGGTAPYSGTGTFVRPAGVHSFTVTDYKGCTAVITKTLTQPSQLLVTAFSGTIACGGITTLIVTANGGTAPYSGVGTFTVNAGPYSYTVTDANGCTAIVNGTVSQPSALSASASNGTITCNGGNTTVSVSANGGTAPHSGIGTFTVNAGPYSYTVTDANGCSSSVSGTITQPSALFASASNGTITCNGGTTTVSVSANGGTAPYSGIGTFTVNAGPYSYTVTDANGCSSGVSGTITQPSALSASASNGTITCNGGTTTVNVSANGGTAPYSGIETFTVNAGPYSYTVSDANGCTAIVNGTVSQPSALSASASNGTITCNGGTTTVSVSANGGTAPYSGIGTFTRLAGPYSYTVTDANGCTAIVNGTVSQPSALSASASNGTITCNAGTTTVSVSANGGTAPYSGIGTFTVNAGPYSYTVTDANGCTAIVSGTISQPSALSASASNGTITCNGGSTTVSVSANGGTAPYSGIGTFTVNAGPYSYTVTDANGCFAIVSGTVTQPSALTASASNGTINCNGGTTTVSISANGGTAPYSGIGTFTVNAGPYSYTVSDANGCTAIVNGTVSQPSALSASASNGTITCNGGTTTIIVSANGSTAPYSGIGTFTVNAGPYSYTVSDANGCIAIVNGTVSQPSALSASASNGTINCNGGSTTVVISANGGTAPYSGIGTFTVNAGPYSYTVSDANGCSALVSGTVSQPSALSASASNGTITCNGGTTTVNVSANGGTAPYSGIGTFTVNAGPYSYTVTDANGCSSSVSGTITQPSALSASASNGTITCNGETTTVSVSANGGTAPYSGIGTFTLNAGPYSYTVSDANGCSALVSGTVSQPSAISASASNGTITCNGGNTTVSVSANGGTAPYSGIGTFTLNAGPYSYTVTDANGCTAIVSGTISQPSALSASASNGTINCNGGSTTVVVSANGGTAPYSGIGTFTRLAGPYSYTVTDANGCSSSVSGTITQPSALSASASNGTITCNGGTTTVSVSANGGTAPYSGIGTFTVNAGPYSYTVTDANGCFAIVSGTITQPSALTASASNGTITCNAGTTTVSVSANGGTAPYSGIETFTVNAGPYSYTVSDANGCTAIVNGTVSQPSALSASASNGTITCNGGNTTVNVSANGGTAPYSGIGTFTRLAGPYSYTVTDANGCFAIVSGTITQPSALSASASNGTITCNAGTTTVSVSANGGTAPYSGIGIFTVNAGPYSYTVTDANGCFAIVSGTVTQPSALTASASNGTITCNAGTTTVSVSANGGTAPYSGIGTFTVNAGPYSYTVTDANGCTAIVNGTVSQPSALSASASNGTITCNGGSTTVSVSANGGTAPYSGIGTFTVNAGPYSYTVSDANGCTAIVNGTVSQPSALSASASNGTITCNGGTTTVSVSANGGTAPYSGIGTFTVNAGPYSYTVTDANGCSSSVSGTVSQPSALSASASNGTITCNGGTTTVSVSANGGTAPYSGIGTFTVNAGPYSYTVTDANGCSSSVSGTITQPSALSASASNGTITCNGGNTTVTISANGGTAPYSGIGTFTRLAGPYSYTVTDANGCFAIVSGTITQPSALTASASNGTITCNGGTTTVSVSANGGTAPYSGIGTFTVNAGPYSYTVTDANGCTAIVNGTVTQPSALSASASNGTITCNGGTTTVSVSANGGTAPYSGIGTFTVNAGPYSYTVTDANGCSSGVSGTITQPSALSASASNGTINCNGGITTLIVTANGGTAPYSGIGTFTVNAGPYSYTVTDANGCTAIVNGTVSQPSALTASASNGTITCNAGTTTVSVSANGGTAPYSGIGIFTVNAGPYSYTVTDANGCTAIVNGTVSQPSALSASASNGTITCNGGSTTVSVSANGGTAPYSGIGTFTVNAGPYSYTVSDANGCTAIVNGTVSQPSALSASASNGTITCNGGTTTVSVSTNGGTAPYSGIGTFTVNAGPYSYTVTDANGCSSSVSGTVSQPSALSASASNGTITCNGGTTTVSVSANGGTAPYSGIGTFTVNAGPYSYTVTDANGCSSSVSGTITQPSALSASASNGTITCNGGNTTVTISANGGTAPYSGIGTFTVNAGPYSYTVTDANGCSSSVSGTITQPSVLSASASNGTINCNGGITTVVVTANGGTAPYSGIGTFTRLAGPYSYTVTDANGCSSSVSGTVTQPSALTAAVVSDSILCNGGTANVTVNATGGTAPYTGTGVFVTAAGTHTYLVSDANGCTISNVILLSEPTPLQASFVADSILCNGGTTSVTITANGGTAPYSDTGIFALTSGLYSFQVSDNNGCKASVPVNITEPLPLDVLVVEDSIVCHGGNTSISITANGGTAPYTGTGTFTVNAGAYSYTVTDAYGCSSSVSGTITQPSALSASASNGTITCNGGTTNVNVSANGGTAPYSGTGTFTVNAGPYTYTVTDANGCTSIVSGTISQPSSLSASGSNGMINCNGGNTTVTVIANGGTAPYSGIGTFTVNAGAYSFTVTDANGCSASVNGTITQPTSLMASSVSGTLLCGGTTTVTISANGGTAPYSGIGTFTVNAGPYSYTVTDANGCTAIVNGTVSQPSALSASASNGTINCNGGTTTVSVSANGGTAPYSGIGTFTRLAGPYSYTVSDANGCTAIVNGTVSQPSALSASASNGNITCNGGTTTVSVSANGGTAPYSGIGTFTRLAGPYSYTVTDANGCSALVSGTVSQPSALSASASNGTITCNGGNTTVSVSANGGTAPYSGIGTFTRLAGPYSYTVTDANGCTAIVNGTVSQPSALSASASNGTITCNGGTTTVIVTANGGTAPYSGIGTFTRLAGPYSYTVTDANGCTAIVNGTVSQPSALSASASNGTITCNGGTTTVSVSANGGTAPYSGIGTFTRLAGPYSYTVTDANGCTAIVNGTVSQPSALSASASNGTITCNGGTTTVSVSANGGTAPYSGIGTFTRLAGPYSYTVTDANGCTAIVNGTVSQPSALSASASNGTINCNGGTTTVSVSANGGTAPYSGIGTFTRLAGPYSYTVTDANGCTAIVNGTVSQPSALSASASNGTINCNGGTTTVIVTANGGTAPYSGIGTFTRLAGPYTYIVTDSKGCFSFANGIISQPSAIILSTTIGTINCHGGTTTINVTASGGTFPYTGTGVFTVNPGPYTFSVADGNGCISSANGTVAQPIALSLILGIDSILCNGGSASATISASGGTAPYSGTGTFTYSAGNQTLTVTDASGCSVSSIVAITEPAPLLVSVVADSILCYGETANVTVNATGGTAPYTGTGVFVTAAGTHTYLVSDANGCTISNVILLSEPTPLQASFVADSILCNGGTTSVTITATGGTAPYSDTGIFALTSGLYSFQVSDNNGCKASVPVNITEPLPLEATFFEDSIRCYGGYATIVINASGGTLPYIGVGTYTTLAGTHNYVVTDSNGCTTSTVMTITQPPALVASSVVNSTILCHGDLASVTVIASGGNGSYLNMVTDSMPCMNDSLRAMLAANGGTVPYSGPGTYYVPAGTYTYGVVDSKCCWDTATIVISEPPALVAIGVAGPAPCLGSETTVTITGTGGTNPYTFTGVFQVPPGLHSFKVMDANACMDTVMMVIDTSICTGFAENSIDENSVFVYPNPNNGSFRISGIEKGNGVILNQAGQLVKEIAFRENEEITVENLSKGMYFLITSRLKMKIVVLSD